MAPRLPSRTSTCDSISAARLVRVTSWTLSSVTSSVWASLVERVSLSEAALRRDS